MSRSETVIPTPEQLICTIDSSGIAKLTLNRTRKHNAFDGDMIEALLTCLSSLKAAPDVRCLILNANGAHFSAGADLHWMKSMAGKSQHENLRDAGRLAALMHQLDTFPHPTIAVVHGSAYGGALGLICCCDIAIAEQDAQFCLSEVKLGLIPATIGPYVCRAMGVRQARRFMLTAERISATTALDLGLLHSVETDRDALHLQMNFLIQSILANSPQAVSAAKQLCQRCENHPIDQALINHTSDAIAAIRVSPEGQEGLNAFFDKRRPYWNKER